MEKIPDHKPAEDILMLRGEQIRVVNTWIDQNKLLFYTENPRIYSRVWTDGEEPSQEAIEAELCDAEYIRDGLIKSIQHNGGLIEPVLVRKNVVLEGNSRLAAYRLLNSKIEKGKWRYLRAKILPDELSESMVFSLLGEYHINGKKDWQPFEQAGYLWRRVNKHDVKIDVLKQELGISTQAIRHLVKVYDFMIEKDDRDASRWSYYDELFKGKRFEKARQAEANFDNIIAGMVKSGQIPTAMKLRDELPLLQEAPKVMKKFLAGKMDFESAVSEARENGAGSTIKKKLGDFRIWISDDERENEIRNAEIKEKAAIQFDLKKLRDRSGVLLKKLFE